MHNRKLSHSQNFLKSQKLVESLVRKSGINFSDIVYEIGPGKGIITQELSKKCKQVVAIETDKNLHADLLKKFGKNTKVKIILHDFLTFNLPKEEYKIFSNIPFNLTADIISKITKTDTLPIDTFLIIQREAALKFSGQPYYKESQYSLLLKPIFELKIIAKLRKSDFQPQPKVDTVLLQIKKRKKPLVEKNQIQLYKDFIVYAFNQWKPTLKKSLRNIFSGIQYNKLSYNLNFHKNSKPTDLKFEQWMGMFEYFIKGVSEEKKRIAFGSEQKLKQQQSKLQKIHRTRKPV
ncbi:MAG: 23S ribosomal RNA methyltransferase Erm [Candidatus Magasanikbacteria bacterium]